ncbi:MAG: nuclear transport factor 2 family protein [Myxococcaceae bacterium]|nr:nuclear transport factor 2 family protein [Myxococcaceae bacterium]
MANKTAALDFLRLAAAGHVDEAYAKFVSPRLVHHNAYFAGDVDTLKAAMRDSARQNPAAHLDVKRAVEENDVVAVHSHMRLQPDTPGIAVVHLMRFENGRIVEWWDIGQQLPADSPNHNGVF